MSNALVAKSYIDLEQLCEPYEINGKMYVKVRMKNGTPKVVRAYSESEYKKFYPEVKIIQPAKSRRNILGFGDAGFIWIFKGDTYSVLDWFKVSPCRYARTWGWYLPSDIEMPNPIPVGIEPIKLEWNEVSLNDQLLNESDIQNIVDSKLYEVGNSQWVGEIGKRYAFTLTCTRMVESNTNYGISYINTMVDENDNIFVWMTASRQLVPGNIYELTGTIKQHQTFRNNKQNILSNCRIKKEIENNDA